MKNNLFKMISLGTGQAKLIISLEPYITAILTQKNVTEIYQKYSKELTQAHAAILWNEFMELALDHDKNLTDFKRTQLYGVLNENGAELIKNTMDEVLFRCLEEPGYPQFAEVNLIVQFDGEYKVTIKDNGQGFPERFLKNFISDKNLYYYLNTLQSHRKKEQQETELELNTDDEASSIADSSTTDESSFSIRSETPNSIDSEQRGSPSTVTSFGGRGIGLRNLVSRVLFGDTIQELRKNFDEKGMESFVSKKNPQASILLSNDTRAGGACIEIVMPNRVQKNITLTRNSMFNAEESNIEAILDKIPKKFGKK